MRAVQIRQLPPLAGRQIDSEEILRGAHGALEDSDGVLVREESILSGGAEADDLKGGNRDGQLVGRNTLHFELPGTLLLGIQNQASVRRPGGVE